MDSGAKRAPFETKRNKAAIRLALSSAYSFGVASDEIAIRIPTCVRRRLSIFSCSSQMRSSHASRFDSARKVVRVTRRDGVLIAYLESRECDVGSRRWRLARPVCPSICGHLGSGSEM